MRKLNVFQTLFLISLLWVVAGVLFVTCHRAEAHEYDALGLQPQTRSELLPGEHRDLDEGVTFRDEPLPIPITVKRKPPTVVPLDVAPLELYSCKPYCSLVKP